MRILYLHQYFVPPQGSGSTRSYEFARRLLAGGHAVQLITSTAMLPASYQALRRRQTTEIAGIPTVIIPVPYANAMGSSQRMKAFLRFAILASYEAMRHRADVVFATSTPLTIAIPGLAARLWQRIPMVFEVRDLWPELPIAVGALQNPVLQQIARGLEWLAYCSAVHVVALSPGMAEGVIRRGMPRERVSVIPNSCDVDLFQVPVERGLALRRRLPGLADEQPLIVYAGTFGKINGVDYLVDVAAAMQALAPEVRFLLVGSGAQWQFVQERAARAGVLDRNLWIWPPIPKVEMPDLLSAATVVTSLFVPLRPMWNNSANKFFDGLAAGRPIAINYGGWQAELLDESGAGIVLPADDAAAAAQSLAAFVQNRDRLRQAAAAAERLAYERFQRDDMAARLETVLQKAVGQ